MHGNKNFLRTLCAIFFWALFSVTACAPKYDAEKCETPIRGSGDSDKYFYCPKDRPLNFNRVIEESGTTFYYENGLSGRKIDRGVDAIKRVQAFCDVPQTVFFLEDTVTHVNGNGLWVNPNDNTELIGAVLLENASEAELPFGIFAGVIAVLLGEEKEFTEYSESRLESSLEEYPYVKELQYPLYTARGTTKNERETAWNFAYLLGEKYLSKHTVNDLKNATKEDILFALEAVDAILPDYYFPVGDSEYPIQIIAENIHYFFAHNFEDCEFNDDLLKYPVLTAFVSENETLIDEVSPIYGLHGLPKSIDAFFGKRGEYNIATTGYSDLRRNAIACYTAGIFGHEIVHHIAYWGGNDGYFQEAICSYFGIKYSYYARHREYLDYTLQTKNRDIVYTDDVIEILKDAAELYNKRFGKSSMSDFNAEAWLQFGTYLYNKNSEHPTIGVLAQGITMVQYIYETYGWDVLMEINRSYKDAQIDGKTYYDFENEWAKWIEELCS